jgi:hypothetical protein
VFYWTPPSLYTPQTTPPTHPRTVDFSGVQLTFTSASILADVLSIEWGLRKAVFKECDLEELVSAIFFDGEGRNFFRVAA